MSFLLRGRLKVALAGWRLFGWRCGWRSWCKYKHPEIDHTNCVRDEVTLMREQWNAEIGQPGNYADLEIAPEDSLANGHELILGQQNFQSRFIEDSLESPARELLMRRRVLGFTGLQLRDELHKALVGKAPDHGASIEVSPDTFWRELHEWLKKHNGRYVCGTMDPHDGTFYPNTFFRIVVDGEHVIEEQAWSADLLEAGCRAWLSAILAMKDPAAWNYASAILEKCNSSTVTDDGKPESP